MAADEVKEYQDDKGVILTIFYLSPDYTYYLIYGH